MAVGTYLEFTFFWMILEKVVFTVGKEKNSRCLKHLFGIMRYQDPLFFIKTPENRFQAARFPSASFVARRQGEISIPSTIITAVPSLSVQNRRTEAHARTRGMS